MDSTFYHEAPLDAALRRALDLVASSVGLILLLPLFLAIAIAIKLHDGGPVFFRGRRVGLGGRIFHIMKFRTMHVNAERVGPGITANGDPRVTPVGRWLRRTKLDELPQLLNVLVGDMGLVGPRPEDPRYVAFYTPLQRSILLARPGITSAASLEYRDEEQLLADQDWEQTYRSYVMPMKLALDLDYLSRRTLWSDIVLIARTLRAIVL